MISSIVRVQVNVPKLSVKAKELVNFIMNELSTVDYDTSLKSYKYQKGKTPQDIFQVQFVIISEKMIDDYIKFLITVEFTTDNAKLIKEDKTPILVGKSKLVFLAQIETDYDKRWSTNKYLHFLKKIFEKYVYNKRIDELSDKLEDEVFDLINSVKAKINVK